MYCAGATERYFKSANHCDHGSYIVTDIPLHIYIPLDQHLTVDATAEEWQRKWG